MRHFAELTRGGQVRRIKQLAETALAAYELDHVGAFMAKLQLHAEHFIAPAGFLRNRWDYEGLSGKALGTDLEQSWTHLSREGRHILNAVGERVRSTMDLLGQEQAVFGLIH